MRLLPLHVVVLALAVVLGSGAFVSAQDMPDASLIHGRALPAPELPNGTVTVRVVREAVGNNLPGQQVTLTVGGAARTATTDDLGRAEFTGLPQGEARAAVTVDGEALESQPFAVPTTGGLRVILIAGIAQAAERRKKEEAEAAAAPATKGVVVLGGDTRIVMEFNNDSLFAFYLLDIVNNARTRVDTGGPLVIDLPELATGASLMEGSSPTASIDGRRVTVAGPFASGTTPVRVQFRVNYGSAETAVAQTFPVALQRTIVGVEKVTGLAMASPQFNTVNDLPTENGVYVLGQGGALAAGMPLTVTFSNLPLHSTAPRYITLGLALLIIGAGVWLSVSGRRSAGSDRQALAARRDALLGELTQLEAKRRDGGIGQERYEARRQRLVGQLEQIYGELDEASPGPQGGGEGLAA
jgi:hypothetical protein